MLTQKYKIYTCRDWYAQPVGTIFPVTQPTDSVVHHMDSPNVPVLTGEAAVKEAFQLARDCQSTHMNVNGWRDSGQHFTVTRSGIILEGRHGSYLALVNGKCIRGAHAADPDTGADDNDSPGTEHEGTYISEAMPQGQWDAMVWLQALICFYCKLDTTTIKGHRDTGCSTACPGDWLHAQLPRLRSEAHVLKVKMIEESSGKH